MSTPLGPKTTPKRPWNLNLTIHQKRTALIISALLGALITTERYILSTKRVTGPSMTPSLNPLAHSTGKEDTVVYLRNTSLTSLLGLWRPLKRGDVIFFSIPHKPDEVSVKRVVGLPGDVVRRDARMVRLGNTNGTRWGYGNVPGRIKVPSCHLFVEGDNWKESLDSNDFGAVSQFLVVGRPIGRHESVWRSLVGAWEAIPGRDEGDQRLCSRTIVSPAKFREGENWDDMFYE